MNLKGSNSRAVIAAVITALVMAAIGGASAFAGASKKRSAKAPAKVAVKTPAKKGVGSAPAPGAPENDAAEHAAFAQALADKLGVPVADVTAALDSLKPAPGTRPDRSTFPQALADKLGLDVATVQAALDAVRPAHGHDGPGGPGDHHGGPFGPNGAAVAAALGVTEAQLKTALDSIRPAEGTRPDPAAFPQKLADALGIPVETVNAALAKFPRPPHGGPGDGPDGGPGDGPDGGPDGDHWDAGATPAPAARAKAPKVAKRK